MLSFLSLEMLQLYCKQEVISVPFQRHSPQVQSHRVNSGFFRKVGVTGTCGPFFYLPAFGPLSMQIGTAIELCLLSPIEKKTKLPCLF